MLATDSETVLASMAMFLSWRPGTLGNSDMESFFDEYMPCVVAHERSCGPPMLHRKRGRAQKKRHLEVHRPLPVVGGRAGHLGGGRVHEVGAHGRRGRNPHRHDQERRHQGAAPTPVSPTRKPTSRPKRTGSGSITPGG